MAVQEGFNLDGRYILTKKLAKGGSSIVYLAVDATGKLKKERAVKYVEAPDDQKQYAAYKQEIALLDELRHPNIADIEYFSEKPYGFFVVMNFIKGSTLSELIEKKGIMTEDFAADVARILSNVLGYLHTVHERPIIFSDLKPENIIIDEHHIPFLLDLGIAHEVIPGEKDTSKPLGTKGYAAPEQYKNGTRLVDERTDIYALGAVLFKMLTGQRPEREYFPKRKGHPEIINDVCSIEPTISSGMAYIIGKCMNPDPDQRFQTMDEVTDSLNNLSLMNEQYISRIKRKLSYMLMGLVTFGIGLILTITGAVWFEYTNSVDVMKHVTTAQTYVSQKNIEKAKDEYVMALILNRDNVKVIEEMYDAVIKNESGSSEDPLQEGIDLVRTNTDVTTIVKSPAFALRLAREAISLNTSIHSGYAEEITKKLQKTWGYKRGKIDREEVDALALIANSNSSKIPDQEAITKSLDHLVERTEYDHLDDSEKANNYYIVLLLYDAYPDYFFDISQYEGIANQVAMVLEKNQNDPNFRFTKKVGLCQSVASHFSLYAQTQTDPLKKEIYFRKAEEWYQKLGDLPLDIDSYVNRGDNLMFLGDYSSAKRMYRLALIKDDQNRSALIGIIRASINEQKATGGADFSEARNYYNELILLGTDNLTPAALDQISSLALEISQL